MVHAFLVRTSKSSAAGYLGERKRPKAHVQYNTILFYIISLNHRREIYGFCTVGSHGGGPADDGILRLERVWVERSRCTSRSVWVGCDFSKKVGVSGRPQLDAQEFRRVEKFFGAPLKTIGKYRYALLAYIYK